MNEYIEKNKALAETWKEPRYTDVMNVLTEIRDRIRSLPSEDVQPVVYCKDCVYWSSKDTRYCNMLQGTFQENDFCSYGKRKGADE